MTNDELKTEIDILKQRLNAYELSDRFMMNKTFQLMDGRNIQLGKGTGTKIGTEATQKIGFFGASPVAQQGPYYSTNRRSDRRRPSPWRDQCNINSLSSPGLCRLILCSLKRTLP